MLLCFNPNAILGFFIVGLVGLFFLIIISVTGEARLYDAKQFTGCLNTKTYDTAQSIGKYYAVDQQPPCWAADIYPSL